jgi:LysM repeat protein
LISIFIVGLFIPAWAVYADSTPTPYDLIAAVNSYREANGLYDLTADSSVMAAAQGHADWIVETGQGGHTGAGGSDETTRAMWAGYGGGQAIACDEAWAATSTISEAFSGAWSDVTHQAVLLNGWGNNYTDIGAGVAQYKTGDNKGNYVMVVDVCLIKGKGGPSSYITTTPGTLVAPSAQATSDINQYITAILTSTPNADGSVTHIVKNGQNLLNIALAYGVKMADIRELNGMAEDSTLIYEGQNLLIYGAGKVPTNLPATETPVNTRTPKPTYTPRPTKPAFTPTPAGTATPTMTPTPKSLMAILAPNGFDGRTVGMILIGICALGLVGVGISSVPSLGKKKPARKIDPMVDKVEEEE